MPKLQIGELAERLGLTPRTLRYYEEIGLLHPSGRLEGGFRLYSEHDLERLERIKTLKQALGFNLSDIKKILEAEDRLEKLKKGYHSSPSRKQKEGTLEEIALTLEGQKALVEERLRQLQEMRGMLEEKLARCRQKIKELASVKEASV